MSKLVKILLVGGVVLIGAMFLILNVFSQWKARENGVPGPQIQALGHDWQTTLIVNDDPEHSQTAVHVIFEAPETFDPQDPVMDHTTFIDLCNVVVQNPMLFDQRGIVPEQLDHVDINLRIDGAKALTFDPSIRLKDGACSTNFYFERSDRNAVKTSSRHSVLDEGVSIVRSWGITQQKITFSSGTAGRVIKVEFATDAGFKRDLKSIDAYALCVLALVSMDEKVNMLVTEIEPSTYDKLDIKIIASQFNVGGIVKSSTSGSRTFALKDGQCGEVV